MLVVTGAGPSSPSGGCGQREMGHRKSGSQKPRYHRGNDRLPEPVPVSGPRTGTPFSGSPTAKEKAWLGREGWSFRCPTGTVQLLGAGSHPF